MNSKEYMTGNQGNKKIVFRIPENFNERSMPAFLENVACVFKMKDKEIENVEFDISQSKDVNLIGLLMIYKFLDYTVKNRCFRHPVCRFSDAMKSKLAENGFMTWVQTYVNNLSSDEKSATYKGLKYQQHDGVFIAPIALDRESENDNSSAVSTQICRYYGYDSHIRFAVITCIGEIMSNFAAHADNETKSVLVASGDRQKFRLACADNGIGIVSNLKGIVDNSYPRLQNYEILQKSLEKGVTSMLDPSSGHMGCGLWIVNQYVTASGGELYVFSEGAYTHNHKGKIRRGRCGYWKGTIIYMTLPLSTPDRLAEVLKD